MSKHSKKTKAAKRLSTPEVKFTSLIHHNKGFWQRHKLIIPVAIVLAFALYFQCIGYGYVLDDTIVITDNTFTNQGFSGIWNILSTESFQGYFNEQKDLVQGGRYRPLSIVTFAIEHGISTSNPALSHFVNILLYGCCGLLLFRLLSMVYPEQEQWYLSIPFVVMIIYLMHPIHTEAVANIKGRDEIMAFLFGLGALFYAMKYLLKPQVLQLVLMGGCYYLGLLSKENILTFAGIIPVFLFAFHRRDFGQIGKVFGLLMVITIAYLIQRYMIIGYLINTTPITDVMNNPFYGMSLAERYATIFYTLGKYLVLSVFPHPLTHDYYPYQIPIMQWGSLWVWLSVIVYTVLSILALVNIRKKPFFAYPWLFYIGTLFIVSNLVFEVGTFMNERFVFISSLGIVWILVHSIMTYLPRYVKSLTWLPLALLGVFGLGYSIKTWTRVPVWENAMTLNRAAVQISKNSARANSFMATALFNEYKVTTDRQEQLKLLKEADVYINRSLAILPNYGTANLMAAGVAAELHKKDNNIEKLLASFKSIWTRSPGVTFISEYLDYLKGTRLDYDRLLTFYAEVGEGLRQQGQYKWALHHLTTAYNIDPNHPQVRRAIAATYRSSGDEATARRFD